jgi:16S rRNA (uracil1498-N3)-methyltransferase
MLHWAYCENLRSDQITVSDAEAHHLIHVLRFRVGSELTLFDGQGTEATAKVVSLTRRDLTCSILSRTLHVRPSRPELIVIASPPKADRLKMDGRKADGNRCRSTRVAEYFANSHDTGRNAS